MLIFTLHVLEKNKTNMDIKSTNYSKFIPDYSLNLIG